MNRPQLHPDVVARMRHERLAPSITQWDFLHLRGLRDLIARALQTVGRQDLVIDLWCGAKPYAPLVSGRVVGVDLDRHFGAADVIATLDLPFADGTFDGSICTQALYLVDDPEATVSELRRVLAPGGWVLVTVPSLYRRAIPGERRYRAEDLRRLFAGWDGVEISRQGGVGTAAAYAIGTMSKAGRRRVPVPEVVLAPVFTVLNVLAALVDTIPGPWRRRLPHQLALTARCPRG